jgi:hypothetical protein
MRCEYFYRGNKKQTLTYIHKTHFDFTLKIDKFLMYITCLNCRVYDSVHIPLEISHQKFLAKKFYILITPDLLEDKA